MALREKLDRAESLATRVTLVRQALLEKLDPQEAWDQLEILAHQVPPVVPAHGEIRVILAQLAQQVCKARLGQLDRASQDRRGIRVRRDRPEIPDKE